jgi:hypothetical protein
LRHSAAPAPRLSLAGESSSAPQGSAPPLPPRTHRARSNDYDDLAARTLNEFERRWYEVAEPFEWNFARAKLIDRLAAHEPQLRLAA